MRRRTLARAALFGGLALSLDWIAPEAVAGSLLQIGAVFIVLRGGLSVRDVRWASAGASLLVVLGAFLPENDPSAPAGLLNRGLALASIWLLALSQPTDRRSNDAARSLAGIVESSDDAIIAKDLDGTVLSWNAGAQRLYGWTPEEAVGRHIALIVPEDRREELDGIMTSLRRGRRVDHLETERVARDGRRIPVSLTVSPVHDESGAVVGASAIARDVSARRRAEEASRFLAAIVTSSDDAIIGKDTQGTILSWNTAAECLYGWSAEEAVGQTIGLVVPDERREELDAIMHSIRQGKHVDHLETERVARDGRRIPVSLTVSPVADASGAIVGASAIARDVSERKRAEEERARIDEKIRETQRLESLGVLAGGIAHDFNNLLVVMLGSADLAKTELPTEAPARARLADIESAAERAADLCRQLLAYSGKGRFVVEPVDLSRLVTEMAQLLEISVSRSAALDLQLSWELPAVEADVTQLRQVIMNLLTNASDAIGSRSGVITIATSAVDCGEEYLRRAELSEELAPGRYVCLEVTDTGAGMDDGARRQIFEPFFTTKETGRGLGLAGVLGIVRGHRGALRVYSEPGRGSSFRVFLPALEGEGAGAVARGQQQESSPLDWRTRGVVLLADDDDSVRKMARDVLASVGFDVLVAADGRETVEVVRNRLDELALVVLDLTMPHQGGVETFRELRRLRSDLPILVTSGYNEQEAARSLAGQAMAGFLQKPWTPRQLLSKARSILEPEGP